MEPTTALAPTTDTYLSYRGKAVAMRKAREWANLNNVVGDREVEVGEVFEISLRERGEQITCWLRYDVTNDGHGNHVISSTRYYTNPEA